VEFGKTKSEIDANINTTFIGGNGGSAIPKSKLDLVFLSLSLRLRLKFSSRLPVGHDSSDFLSATELSAKKVVWFCGSKRRSWNQSNDKAASLPMHPPGRDFTRNILLCSFVFVLIYIFNSCVPSASERWIARLEAIVDYAKNLPSCCLHHGNADASWIR